MPAGTKTDPLLAKAKPISDSGSLHNNIFKKGKNLLWNSSREGGVRLSERNNCRHQGQ